jgi:hypothetical protein
LPLIDFFRTPCRTACMFSTNGVPTVWGFLLIAGVLVIVFVKLLFIDKRRPRQPGGADSWSGDGNSHH